MALPLFNTKITSHRCKHCGGSGYKKSRYDGYMHVCSYCSGTGRKLVLTRKYEIKKGQPDADPKFIVLAKDQDILAKSFLW